MTKKARNSFWTLAGVLSLAAVVLVVAVVIVSKPPKAEPWQRWEAHDPQSNERVSHHLLDGLLKRYLQVNKKGANLFAYKAVEISDKAVLKAYIKRMSEVEISKYNRDQQMAYWINLYNAVTLKVVLDHYPVDSIVDIKLGGSSLDHGPWDEPLVTVEGVALSLNDIEHRILRPIWQDPRIHYAVNCASISCPDLAAKVYDGRTIDRQLDKAALAYINDDRAFQIDSSGRLIASSIYDWYGEDFGDGHGDIMDHWRNYAYRPRAALLEGRQSIDDFDYDWRLNGGDKPKSDINNRRGSYSR